MNLANRFNINLYFKNFLDLYTFNSDFSLLLNFPKIFHKIHLKASLSDFLDFFSCNPILATIRQPVVYIMTFFNANVMNSGEEWGQSKAFSFGVSSWSLGLQFCLFSIVARTFNISSSKIARHVSDFPFCYESSERIIEQCCSSRWVSTHSSVPLLRFHLFCSWSPLFAKKIEKRIFRALWNSLKYYSCCQHRKSWTLSYVVVLYVEMTLVCQPGQKSTAISLIEKLASVFPFLRIDFWINFKQAWYLKNYQPRV